MLFHRSKVSHQQVASRRGSRRHVPLLEQLEDRMLPSHTGPALAAFEIKDFPFGVENPTTIGSGTGGAGAGKIKFNEFTIKKTSDGASPAFFKNCCVGAHYKTVTIDMRKAGGDPKSVARPFLQFELETVYVTKIDWSGPGDEGPETDFNFASRLMEEEGIFYYFQHAAVKSLIVAPELQFQTEGPIICQALFQRLAPRAPQYGAQINYAGDRLDIYFDPAYTVTTGDFQQDRPRFDFGQDLDKTPAPPGPPRFDFGQDLDKTPPASGKPRFDFGQDLPNTPAAPGTPRFDFGQDLENTPVPPGPSQFDFGQNLGKKPKK